MTNINNHELEMIESSNLVTVAGGGWFGDAASAVGNFGNGFVAGAVHGTGLTSEHASESGIDNNAPGSRPGVETGMMVNMALGPIGKVMNLGANAVESGAKWVDRQLSR